MYLYLDLRRIIFINKIIMKKIMIPWFLINPHSMYLLTWSQLPCCPFHIYAFYCKQYEIIKLENQWRSTVKAPYLSYNKKLLNIPILCALVQSTWPNLAEKCTLSRCPCNNDDKQPSDIIGEVAITDRQTL